MNKNLVTYIVIIVLLLIGLAAVITVGTLAFLGASNVAHEKTGVGSTPIAQVSATESFISTPYTIEKTSENTPVIPKLDLTPSLEPSFTTTEPVSTTGCNLSGQMIVLIIGQDEGQGEPPYGADAIRLIRVNFDNQSASTFAFPRDLYLPSPHLEESYGITKAHLGSVYDIVMKREGARSDAKLMATTALAQAIYDNFAIIPDHYVNLNQNSVISILDLVGGIDVDIPVNFGTPNYSFNTGPQHLDSAQAWDYLSQPSADWNEWDRFLRQDLVFTALRSRLLEPENYGNLINIYSQISANVMTDLSPEQIAGLICILNSIPLEQIKLNTFPSSMIIQYEDHSMEFVDSNAAKDLVIEQLQ